jgi:lipopolysaccharide transport system ATP-binding protein
MTDSRDFVIRVENLSKVYQKKNDKGTLEDFSALTDVNFEIKKGEVIGIIGKNGSGKSTLLKILSGLSKPSSGKIEIRGIVASILDVGTGFHPDLSGRSNIYLRGGLLEMTKNEIDAAIDEIIEFSEIGDFIETPVKNYSSGMFLRLAFSTLVFLKCDILLLDEVMAVGDLQFKEKSLNKIRELANSDKTIVVVTHEIQSISNLTNKIILLEKGLTKGISFDSVDKYLNNNSGFKYNDFTYKNFFNDLDLELLLNNVPVSTAEISDSITVRIKGNKCGSNNCELALRVRDSFNNVVFVISYLQNEGIRLAKYERFVLETVLPSNYFNRGVFYIDLIGINVENNEINFEYRNVEKIKYDLGGYDTLWLRNSIGPVRPFFKWEIYDNN